MKPEIESDKVEYQLTLVIKRLKKPHLLQVWLFFA